MNFLFGLLTVILVVIIVLNPSLIPLALILSIILLIVFILRNRDIQKQIYPPIKDKLHILNVDKGGVFTLTGVGDDSEELTLKVVSKNLYQEGDFYWYELECDKGSDEKVWVDVEDDDGVMVNVMLKKLTLSDIGVTSSRLDTIDDNESGSVRYGGSSYKYVDSDSAVFYRFCDSKNPQKFYYWDFVCGNRIISVEKWSDGSFDVSLSQRMLPSQITVLSNKNEEQV
ncbi:MAG: DUF4178 domain-containing protein [Candidatus Gastranaerophilales bacterium]|nr:DUF4178 domain-containing protein [Candidatus Gastranaerophilales bacterium]